jgi:RES domain-containing protein
VIVWRLASRRYPPLSGDGARLVGGRWNSAGYSVVYGSESLALCLAECLVHLPGPLPSDYMAFKLSLPEESLEMLDSASLKSGWQRDIGYTRAVGDQWIRQGRSLALAVPSAVLAESMNILINPAHSRGHEVNIEESMPFEFDSRLRPSG